VFRKMFILMIACLGLVAAGCAPATTATPDAPQSAAAPAVTPTVLQSAAAPAATSAPSGPGVTATQPATAPTTPVPTSSSAAASATSGTIRFVIVEGTEARYKVKEQLASRNLPSDAIGTTQAVTGTVVIQPDGTIVRDQSKIVVDLQTLRSDESRRDNFISRNTLQTSQYPTVEFVPTEARGLPVPLPTSGQGTFELVGDLTLHGVTKPITWQVNASLDGQSLTGTATTSFKFADFGMTVPRAFVVLSVEDNIRLEIDFKMLRQS
jgi:polyisoprenoid-binding protein YceI